MMFREVPPCPALQPFVRHYLLVHLPDLAAGYQVKPYPTRVEQALVFFARGRIVSHDPHTGRSFPIARNALYGQHVSRRNFETFTAPDFLMLMVVFQPGVLHRLLGFASHELTAAYCDAEALLTAELPAVNDRIANARSYAEMVAHAEAYVLGLLRGLRREAHPIDRMGDLLLHQPLPFSLDRLAHQANLSPRQFERKFNERLGVGPKLYSRISRFFQAFSYKEAHPQADWLTVATEFGYTDYAHLAKDFKQFAHVTPNVLLQEHARRPETTVGFG